MPIRIESRPPKDIYNLPLFSGYLVIDGRPTEAFAAGHLMTATSFPPPPPGANVDETLRLVQLVETVVMENSPDNYDTVVLYGAADGAQDAQLQAVAARLVGLLEVDQGSPEAAAVAQAAAPAETLDLGPLGEREWVTAAMHRMRRQLAQRCTQIWLLQGGFEAFAAQFPFQVVRDESFQDIGAPAFCCEDFLFLGSRAFKPTLERLRAMGITHVITQDPRAHNPQSFFDAPPEVIPGIQYLQCDVRDADAAPMGPCWDAATQFIEEARRGGGRVLVQLHGRSRSVSVIAAFYVDAFGLSCDAAIGRVAAVCRSFDLTLVHRDELLKRPPKRLLT